MSNKHIGSSFDDFLEDEGTREEVEAVAVKRILAYELKKAMAKKMDTSRSQLDPLITLSKTSSRLRA